MTRKPLTSVVFSALITVSVTLTAPAAQAQYLVIDNAQIQAINAQAAAQLAKIKTMVAQQIQEMNLETMLAKLKMQNDQNLALNDIVRKTNVMTDVYNKQLEQSLEPGKGVCAAISASLKMSDRTCDINAEQENIATGSVQRLFQHPDERKSDAEQRSDQLAALEQANANAANSRLQSATVVRGLMGEIGNLSQSELNVIKKTLEASKTPVQALPPDTLKGTDAYNRVLVERQNQARVETVANSAIMRMAILDSKSASGGDGWLTLLRTAVSQYYGPAEGNTGLGSGQRLNEILVDTAGKPETVDVTIKELLTVESMSLYLDYLNYEQSLRIEGILGHMLSTRL